MTDAERYAITVRKIVVDGEEMWRATVKELPDLAEFAESREEAIELALDAIESLRASALEDGRPFPEPSEDEEEYSGRVTLRMPKSLHRAVALKAVDEDVSLNWYIVTNLAIGLNDRAESAIRSTAMRPLMAYPPTITGGASWLSAVVGGGVLVQDLDLTQNVQTASWGQVVGGDLQELAALPRQVEDYEISTAAPRRRRVAARG